MRVRARALFAKGGMRAAEAGKSRAQNGWLAMNCPYDSHKNGFRLEMPGRAASPSSSASSSVTSNPAGMLPIRALPLFSQYFLGTSERPRRVCYKEPDVAPLPVGGLVGEATKLSFRPRPSSEANIVERLQLTSVERFKGPPSETEARRARLKMYALDCTPSFDHMYLGGHMVAQSREILRAHGITHIVNCVRFEHNNYFQDEFKYLGLYLQGGFCHRNSSRVLDELVRGLIGVKIAAGYPNPIRACQTARWPLAWNAALTSR